MTISRLSVHHFRTHELFGLDFHPNTTLILGANGSGKTSLLEAIYLLERGSSFRGRDRDLISHDHADSEAKLLFSDESTRRVRLSLTAEQKILKQFEIAGVKKARLKADERLPVVLFEPDELRLLSSSPTRRRDFVDGIIARLSPTYSGLLSRFQRTLAQRNELLKQLAETPNDASESQLFVWDLKFSELGASITKARRNFLEHANGRLSTIYSELAGGEHVVSARYVSTLAETETLQQTILARLERSRNLEKARGFTQIGPHRDDIELSLDSHLASETASRGEARTIMLAFKLLEVELQEHHTSKKPLILLDDVFSELDTTRENALLAALENYQTIITATDLRDELKVDAKIIEL